MILRFGNVTLRAIEKEDSVLLMHLINNPAVEAMTVGGNSPVSEYMQEEWIKNYRDTQTLKRWMIELDNGVTLGMITLSDINWKDRHGFIQYKINPEERNRLRGDMKNALYAVVKYSFEELGLNRLEGSILEYNTFSKKMIQSMGFVKEGVARSKVFKMGKWWSEEYYGLLSSEFVYYEDGVAPWQ